MAKKAIVPDPTNIMDPPDDEETTPEPPAPKPAKAALMPAPIVNVDLEPLQKTITDGFTNLEKSLKTKTKVEPIVLPTVVPPEPTPPVKEALILDELDPTKW